MENEEIIKIEKIYLYQKYDKNNYTNNFNNK